MYFQLIYENYRKMRNQTIYNVLKLAKPIKIDGDWEKTEWQKTDGVKIVNFMGQVPGFQPVVRAKMMYDDENLYVIFQVIDRYVHCITNVINGPVWEDSCVEFFFAPDHSLPERYFNLEINCGGTPLMHYNVIPDKNIRMLDPADIKMIEIAHSLQQIIDPEISDQVTWIIEYRIPLALPEKYSMVTHPEPGVEWRANFYKIAENNSNPHYMTWAIVNHPVPDFHLPHFFGLLKFQ
jgi:hypothetical protein